MVPIDLGSCTEIESDFSSIGEGSNYILSEFGFRLWMWSPVMQGVRKGKLLTLDLANTCVSVAVPFRDNINRTIMKHKPAEHVTGHCFMSHREST